MKMETKYGQEKMISVIRSIRTGDLAVPAFQRLFVWDAKKIAKFYDSVLVDGSPFGSLITWRSEKTDSVILANEKNLFEKIAKLSGVNRIRDKPREFLIDGQQRLTSFAMGYLLYHEKTNENELDEIKIIKKIVYDPESGNNKRGEFKVAKKSDKNQTIPAHIFFADSLDDFEKELENNFSELKGSAWSKAKTIYTKINELTLGQIRLENGELQDAIDTFTNLNTGGRKLSSFNLCNAHFANENGGFSLTKMYSLIRDGLSEEWEIDDDSMLLAHYAAEHGKINSSFILRSAGDAVSRATELNFMKNNLKRILSDATQHLSSLGYQGVDALPSDKFLYIMAHAISNSLNRKNLLDRNAIKKIKEWFRWSALNGQYGSGAKSSDFEKDLIDLDKAINGEEIKPSWFENDEYSEIDILDLKYGSQNFKFLYVWANMLSNVPSLETGKVLNINGRGNFKENIHHIFPRKGNQKVKKELIDSMANLTPLEAIHNQKISNESPAKYLSDQVWNDLSHYCLPDDMLNFRKKEKDLADHAEKMIKKRAKLLAAKLNNDWK